MFLKKFVLSIAVFSVIHSVSYKDVLLGMNSNVPEKKEIEMVLGIKQGFCECVTAAAFHYRLFRTCKSLSEFETIIDNIKKGKYNKAYNEHVDDMKMAVKNERFLEYLIKLNFMEPKGENDVFAVSAEIFSAFASFVKKICEEKKGNLFLVHAKDLGLTPIAALYLQDLFEKKESPLRDLLLSKSCELSVLSNAYIQKILRAKNIMFPIIFTLSSETTFKKENAYGGKFFDAVRMYSELAFLRHTTIIIEKPGYCNTIGHVGIMKIFREGKKYYFRIIDSDPNSLLLQNYCFKEIYPVYFFKNLLETMGNNINRWWKVFQNRYWEVFEKNKYK